MGDPYDHLESGARDEGARGPTSAATAGGAKAAVKGAQRGMSFAAGEALTTPHEARGATPRDKKPRGEVDLGAGPDVAAVPDVPRGESARIEALVAAAEREGVPAEAEARAWDTALDAASTTASSCADAVEAAFVAHATNEPTSHAFLVQHGVKSKALKADATHLAALGAQTRTLQVNTGAVFVLVAMAERDFAGVRASLVASGHARDGDAGLEVDGARLAGEDAALEEAAGEAALVLEPASADVSVVEMGRGRMSDAVRDMAGIALELRKRNTDAHAEDVREQHAAIAERVELIRAIDDAVQFASSLPGQLGGLETLITSEDKLSDIPSVPGGLLTTLLAHGDIAQMKRLAQTLAAYEGLGASYASEAREMAIEQHTITLEERIRGYLVALDTLRKSQRAHERHLGNVGGRLDREARDEGQLGARHERFEPIARREGRRDTALASTALAEGPLVTLEREAQQPAHTFRELMAGTPYKDLHDIRMGLGTTNVPAQLRRRITRLGKELSTRRHVLESAGKDEGDATEEVAP